MNDKRSKGITIEPSGAGKALLVDGTVQSVSLASPESLIGYWSAMLPDVRPRSALILGLGGGTLAQLLLRRFGPLPLVGVDDDPRIVEIGTQELGLDPTCLQIIIDDAFAYTERCRERFDYIAVDLYRGVGIPPRLFTVPFLRQLSRLLRPRAWLVFNLTVDPLLERRIERLARFFRLERKQVVGKNVVIHAHGRCRR